MNSKRLHHKNEEDLRSEIVQVGQWLHENKLVVATDGNISARLDKDTILITPRGLCKGKMTSDQLIKIDLNGQMIGKEANNGGYKPSSETPMHLEVYRQRPDVQAMVHAHPPYTIALSIMGISLEDCMLPEAIVFLGIVPTTSYATPSSEENVEAIRKVIQNHDAVVLERHGSLTVGDSPLHAFYRTETLEHLARITYLLNQMGGGRPLPPYQVKKLLRMRRELNLAHTTDEQDFGEVLGLTPP